VSCASDLHSWTSIEHHSESARSSCFAKCVEGMHCSFAFLEESKFILEEFATCVLFNNVPGEDLAVDQSRCASYSVGGDHVNGNVFLVPRGKINVQVQDRIALGRASEVEKIRAGLDNIRNFFFQNRVQRLKFVDMGEETLSTFAVVGGLRCCGSTSCPEEQKAIEKIDTYVFNFKPSIHFTYGNNFFDKSPVWNIFDQTFRSVYFDESNVVTTGGFPTFRGRDCACGRAPVCPGDDPVSSMASAGVVTASSPTRLRAVRWPS
jgi:hypothetical protein